MKLSQFQEHNITNNKIISTEEKILTPFFFALLSQCQPLLQHRNSSKEVDMTGDATKLYQIFIIIMNCLRQLPSDYLEGCPVIDQKYRVLFKLGVGRFSQVRLAIRIATGQRVAVKIMNHRIDQATLSPHQQQRIMEVFLNQVRMAFEAKHRSVVQIIDFNVGGVYRAADGRSHCVMYYVMRIEEYGELWRVIQHTEQFSERTARYIFRQLIQVLRGMHAKRIGHCDIKSENILMDSKFNIKLIDFGCARYCFDLHSLPIHYQAIDSVGSLKSNAPQLIAHGEYQADQIDVFAAGCLLFQLVMKAQPFKSADIKDEHYSRLTSNDKKKFWDIFGNKMPPSPEFKDLIQKMLAADPKQRISLQAVMQHAWTNGQRVNRDEFKKQMGGRVKKVMVRVRKQQELQVKQSCLRERTKRQVELSDRFQLCLTRAMEEEVIQLKTLIIDHSASAVSDCNSLEESEEVKTEHQQ